MESFRQDLTYTLRTLLKRPGFTAAVVATLALGIGANGAMFSVVDTVALKALGYPDENRIVVVYGTDIENRIGVSELEREYYRTQIDAFASVAAFTQGWTNLTGDFQAERVLTGFVNAEIFSVLGVLPANGRAFSAEEDERGRDDVVILSHELWHERFGGDPQIVGSSIMVDGGPLTVIGVMPEDFRLPTDYVGTRSGLFVPLALNATPDPRNIHYLGVVARLVDGISLQNAKAEMDIASQRLKETIGTLPPTFRAAVVPVRDEVLGAVRPTLFVLFGSVALVLVIACVNVANLLLARAESRAHEMAIRLALGGARLRVARQLLTESVVLGLLGGGAGLILAAWMLRIVRVVAPPGIPRIDDIAVDPRAIAFTIAVAGITGLVFGLAPVLHFRKDTAGNVLRADGRGGTAGIGRHRMRRTLVIAEVAVGLMLAVGAGLLAKSYQRLTAVDPGFNGDRVLTARISLPSQTYPTAADARQFYRQVFDEVRGLPGVVEVGGTNQLPLASRPGDWGVRIEGREEERLASGRRPWADWIIVSDGYFETLGVQVLDGRLYDRSDHDESAPVVVINETMAQRYWADGEAMGSRFHLSSTIDTVFRTVIGIVRDVRHNNLRQEPRPQMYLPLGQFPSSSDFVARALTMTIRTANEPTTIIPEMRQVVSALDSDVPLSNVRPMGQVITAATAGGQFNVMLFSGFGLLGLMLVSVGVYGIVSYTVTQRTRELGIRMALGASQAAVLALIVGQSVRVALVGIALGLLGAFTASRLITGMLFEIDARDPVVFATVSLLLIVVTIVASYLPARRATTVDPTSALRDS